MGIIHGVVAGIAWAERTGHAVEDIRLVAAKEYVRSGVSAPIRSALAVGADVEDSVERDETAACVAGSKLAY